MQGVQQQGEAVSRRAEKDRDVKVPKLTEENDIVAYLSMFKRIMKAYEIQEGRLAFKLAANLIGKAQQAYASLNDTDASSYKKIERSNFTTV